MALRGSGGGDRIVGVVVAMVERGGGEGARDWPAARFLIIGRCR
jgi:hypothetical protein